MRLIALSAMLAAVTSMSLCERRNPALCREGDSALGCAEGLVCRDDHCEVPDCTDNAGCTDEQRPICVREQGVCVGCQSDTECEQRSPDARYCRAGRCVACTQHSDCRADAANPVCDPQTFRCRPCRLHRECDGVCAKDDLHAPAIPAGTCVPRSQVLYVDANRCAPPSSCTAKDALDRVTPARPYVVLQSGQGSMFTNLVVPGPNNMSGLKVVHIIGPMADEGPAGTTVRPAVTLGGALSRALAVEPGHRVVLEGVAIEGGFTGVECSGVGGGETELRLERVLIGNTETAVVSTGCRLRLRDSWIGAGFAPVFSGMLGNRQALKLVNTEFAIENTVLFRNGLPVLPGTFGGIEVTVDPMWPGGRSVIANSTIAAHDVPTASGAVSLDCNGELGDRLVIFNTFFYNDLLSWQMRPTRHVGPACRPLLGHLASNDPELAKEPGSVLVPSAAEAGFRDVKNGNLRLMPGTPAPVAMGGVERFTRGTVDLPAPETDLEGRPRGRRQQGRVSIGAFEVPGP